MSTKAPAFQFYYDRFNSSTALWDDAQVGKYIRLLICQANKRYVTAKELKKVVSDDDPDILAKFKEVEPGKFVNHVLDGILIDRDNYYQRQAENGSKGGRPPKPTENPNETQTKPKVNPGRNPTPNPEITSITTTTSTTIPNTEITTTTTQKNTADADLLALFREEVVGELNDLTGRDFDPHAKYFRRDLDARIKEYGADDLKDMIRCMVYKRKGSEWEQYLKPDTMFAAKKCGAYMDEMRQHRKNGTMPKKDNTKPGGKKLLDPMEVLSYMQQKAS